MRSAAFLYADLTPMWRLLAQIEAIELELLALFKESASAGRAAEVAAARRKLFTITPQKVED